MRCKLIAKHVQTVRSQRKNSHQLVIGLNWEWAGEYETGFFEQGIYLKITLLQIVKIVFLTHFLTKFFGTSSTFICQHFFVNLCNVMIQNIYDSEDFIWQTLFDKAEICKLFSLHEAWQCD